jgi:hypothetical protein
MPDFSASLKSETTMVSKQEIGATPERISGSTVHNVSDGA